MYTLRFKKSLSKNYTKALEMAKEFGARVNGEDIVLEIPDYELMYAYEKIHPLLGLIQKWRGTSAAYNGKKVDPYRFIFRAWHLVHACGEANNNIDSRHCWIDRDHEGWGCRFLLKISSRVYGKGDYKKSERFWYNFGEFDENRNWIINKKLILQILLNYAHDECLTLCPFFDTEKIKRKVNELPDQIILDGVNFRPFYQDGIMVNIRHCSELLEAGKHIIGTKAAKLNDICFMNQVSFMESPKMKIGRN